MRRSNTRHIDASHPSPSSHIAPIDVGVRRSFIRERLVRVLVARVLMRARASSRAFDRHRRTSDRHGISSFALCARSKRPPSPSQTRARTVGRPRHRDARRAMARRAMAGKPSSGRRSVGRSLGRSVIHSVIRGCDDALVRPIGGECVDVARASPRPFDASRVSSPVVDDDECQRDDDRSIDANAIGDDDGTIHHR